MSGQEYACYVDFIQSGEHYDGCVLDYDKPQDCDVALSLIREGKTRFDCKHWRQVEKKANEFKWQPIATAPKDGSYVLVYDPDVGFPYTCTWEYGEWTEASGEQYMTFKPTHWMPLPEPPK